MGELPALFIPSPPINGWQLGPVYLHIYALCLITGIALAWTIGLRRWRARGGTTEQFETVLTWTIPLGIVGARVYHVLTHWQDYVGPGLNPIHMLYIWEGGIAIYGAILGGALTAYVVTRRMGLRFWTLADALAPGIAVGQAVGRFGNWFNQELFGLPTTLPWALEIAPEHRPPGYEQFATFHPTFLYESLWSLVVVAGITVLADRRFRLGHGRAFLLYLGLYSFGRIWTEHIRTDPSNVVFAGIRINEFVAGVLCLAAFAAFAWLSRSKPGREDGVWLPGRETHPADDEVAIED